MRKRDGCFFSGRFYFYFRVALSTVGIDKGSGHIHDGASSPEQFQSGLFRYDSDFRGLEIFLISQRHEGIGILRFDHDGHSFLGFTDRQFGSVQTGIFLRHQIQIHFQSGCQFTDGYAYAAGAEVVADLDEMRRFRPPEESLQFPFGRCVSFLDFSTAGRDGFFRMCLGGSRSTADSVTSGPAAEQDDHIAGFRLFSLDVLDRSGRHDRTEFHMFRNIAWMIDLLDITGRKTDLVAVGAVAVCCFSCDLSLRKFARNRIPDMCGRIRSAGDSHGLIDIASSGQRVADRAAQTGRCAAEGFDLGRMIMSLVLEH